MMIKSVVAALEQGQFYSAMYALQAHPASTYYADACRLLAQVPAGLGRSRIRIALGDLLTRRPDRVWLMPVIIEVCGMAPGTVQLPAIDALDLPSGVTEMKWLGLNGVSAQFEQEPVVTRGVPTSVLLLICAPDAEDPPELTDAWFSEVFFDQSGILLAAGPALDFAEGIEAAGAAAAMLRAEGVMPATPCWFLSDDTWSAIVNLSMDFKSARASQP